jgi:rfaE bifunctional protein nucleotidyltransferase chain/domain
MNYLQIIADKILDKQQLVEKKGLFESRKTVFTNGCFDILHQGHVDYLAQAATLGDILIIGLNSDRSVKKLKGEGRPINSEMARAKLLAALFFVDYIIIFEEDTPYNLIQEIKPNVLVKASDYSVNTIVGADLVRAMGGEVAIIPFTPDFSSTSILGKIKKNATE